MKKLFLFLISALILTATAIAATIAITPSISHTNDNLICAVNPTPGAYIYKWYNNGNYLISGQTLSNSYTSHFQTYICKVYLPPTPFTGQIYLGESSNTVLNTPPTAPTVSFTSGPYYANSVITATASGSTDADGDAITYEYRYVRSGSAIDNDDVLACSSGVCHKHDTITAEARAFDGTDYSTWASQAFTISNSVPEYLVIGCNQAAVYSNSTVTIWTAVSDADNDILTYNYKFVNLNDSLTLQDSASNALTLDLSSAHDTIRVYVNVSDGESSIEGYTDIPVQNTAPVIQDPGAQTAFVGYAFTLQINASDVDNDTLIYTDDNALFDIDSNGLINFTANSSDVGVHNVNITASDGAANTDVLVQFNVVESVPIVENLSVTNPLHVNDGIECNFTITDNFEQNLIARIDLYNNDSLLYAYADRSVQNGTEFSELFVLPSWTTKGDNWTCAVTPFNGISYGAQVNASVVVSNTAPVIENLSAQTAYVNHPFSIQINASDIDNDNLTFSDDSALFDIDSNGLINFTPSGGDVGTQDFNVTAGDGTDNSTITVSLDVQYETPIMQSIYISPDPAYTTDDLVCNASFTDMFGTNLTAYWAWYNGSNLFSSGSTDIINGTESTITTLSNASTAKGETWFCYITPYDGFNNGSTFGVNRTIQNSAPVINSYYPGEAFDRNVNMTGNFDWLFNDSDGDDLNFTSISPANLTVQINNDTNEYTLIPDTDWYGTGYVNFTAFDDEGASVGNDLLVGVGRSIIVDSWIESIFYASEIFDLIMHSEIKVSTVNASNVTGPTIDITESYIYNSNIIDSILFNCTVLDSWLEGAYCQDSWIDPSMVIYSNVTGSIITNSTVLYSDATYSNVTNSTINSSNVNGSIVLDSQIIEGSTVYDSNISIGSLVGSSNITNLNSSNSLITGSVADNVNVSEGAIVNSIVNDSDISRGIIVDSTADNVTLISTSTENIPVGWFGNDTLVNELIENFTLIGENSNISNSIVIDSTVYSSNLTGFTINSSNLVNVSGTDSYIENSNVHDIVVYNANITDGIVYSGTITVNGTNSTANNNSLAEFANYAPVAGILVPSDQSSWTVNTNIIFTSNSTDANLGNSLGLLNDSLTYSWDFGDGTNITTANLTVTHSYNNISNYAVTLTVTDSFGLADTSSINILTTIAPPASSGGNGGKSRVHYITLSKKPVTLRISENEEVKFKFSGIEHTVVLEKVYPSYVMLTVESEEQKGFINSGQTMKFNLNNDSYYDIAISVDKIYQPNEASLKFQLIKESVEVPNVIITEPVKEEPKAEEQPKIEEPEAGIEVEVKKWITITGDAISNAKKTVEENWKTITAIASYAVLIIIILLMARKLAGKKRKKAQMPLTNLDQNGM